MTSIRFRLGLVLLICLGMAFAPLMSARAMAYAQSSAQASHALASNAHKTFSRSSDIQAGHAAHAASHVASHMADCAQNPARSHENSISHTKSLSQSLCDAACLAQCAAGLATLPAQILINPAEKSRPLHARATPPLLGRAPPPLDRPPQA